MVHKSPVLTSTYLGTSETVEQGCDATSPSLLTQHPVGFVQTDIGMERLRTFDDISNTLYYSVNEDYYLAVHKLLSIFVKARPDMYQQ